MNVAAVSSSFTSTLSESERDKLRAQLSSQIAELDRQDELERVARRVPVVDQVKKLINDYKISPAELFPTKVKAEARYQYYDEEEQDAGMRNKTWNGRGTMPNALKGREDECLIPGKKHIKSIEKILADRALNRASNPLPNSGLSEVRAVSNAAEIQPTDQIVPAVQAITQPTAPTTDSQAVDIKPMQGLTELHPARQNDTQRAPTVNTNSEPVAVQLRQVT